MGKRELAMLEGARWHVLKTVEAGGVIGATATMILYVVQAETPFDSEWVREQLDYLEGKGLVAVERHEVKDWRAKLTPEGTDFVTYVSPAARGIERPPPEAA